MNIEIKSRFTGKVIFSGDFASIKLCLRAAVKAKADLRDADLRGADLRDADLRGAYLRDADGKPIKRATPDESIANLDKVREIILDNQERLNMGTWHDGNDWIDRSCAEEAVCGTSHCLAGWLQVCSTDPNIRKLDAHLAGIVSAPVASKMFFREDGEVLAWMKDRKYAEEAKEYE